MNTQPDPSHVNSLQSELDRLGKAPAHRVEDFITDPLYGQHTFQGIYAISDPDDDLVYFGKTNDGTKEKGLADRICGHAAKKSELQVALGIEPNVFKRYSVRAARIDDPIHRGLTELYAIAILRPRANRFARKPASPSYDDPPVKNPSEHLELRGQ